ncbi:MAG: hypothetical protein IJ376_02495, partial [Acidaminococcaceae bacterium]|nr:hypothetical protein [Acidaminococcaceae bacterium]
MNKIYKVVWSKVKNCYVVVSELAKNVITGSVKSAKVGTAPMVKGMAMGVLMAFMITGNVSAYEHDTIETRVPDSIPFLNWSIPITQISTPVNALITVMNDMGDSVDYLDSNITGVKRDVDNGIEGSTTIETVLTVNGATTLKAALSGTTGTFDGAITASDFETKTGTKFSDVANRVDVIEADYLKAADKTALSEAISSEKTRAEGIEAGLRTDVDTIKGDYLKAADKTELETAYKAADSTLKTEVTNAYQSYADGKATALETAINTEKERATDAENTISGRVTAIENDYLKKADKTALQGNIDELASGAVKNNTEAIAEINHAETGILATAKGYADTQVNALANGAVKTNTEAIAEINHAETGILVTAKGYADTQVNALANGAVKTNTEDITALQGTVGGHTTAITDLTGRVSTNESNITTLQTNVSGLGDRVATAETNLENKADKATTLAGYGITDGMTADQVKQMLVDNGLGTDDVIKELGNKTRNINSDKTVSGTTYFNGNVEVGGNVHFNGIDLNAALIKKIDNNATGDDSIALGTNAVASEDMTVAVGTLSEAKAACAVAVGSGTKALGQQAVAIGSGSISNGEGSLAIGAADFLDYSEVNGGDGAGSTTASGRGAIALGYGSEANEDGAIALGGDGRGNVSEANGVNSIALGVGAIANNDYSIALGSYSVADEDNVVSVGSGDEDHKDTYQYRRIVNVADGDLNETSTDAVNGRQLHAIKQEVDDMVSTIGVTYNLRNINTGVFDVTSVNGITVATAKEINGLYGEFIEEYNNGSKLEGNDDDLVVYNSPSGVVNLSAIKRNTQNITAEAGKTYIDGELTVNKGAENQIVIGVNGITVGLNSTHYDNAGVYAGRINTNEDHSYGNAYAAISADGKIKGAKGAFVVDTTGNVTGGTYNGVTIGTDEGDAIVNDVNINDLATQVGNNAIKIGEVEQGYKDADAALKAEVVKGYEDADKALSDRIDSNAAKIDEVETAYKAEDAAVRSEFANADAALKAEVVKGYEDADKTLSDRIASNTTKIDEVETAYKAEDAAIRSEFTNADAALKAEVVKGYEDADKVLSDRIDANAAAIEGLDDRVASNTEAIANSNTAIENLDGRVASNTEAIANANKAIADVDGRVASNTEAIANANTAIENLDGRVASNTEAIANANKAIADVDGRVASNTEAIA